MNMSKIDDLATKNDKLEGRAEYLQGKGYDVRLEVKYTRVRRVRALNEEQAKEFAVIREAKYAPNYFHAQNHSSYSVDEITPLDVALASNRADKEVIE